MNYKKISPIFLVLTACFSLQNLMSAMPQMPARTPAQQMPGAPAGGPQLSLEDLQAMEKFVEEERAKMTDEQRAQFDKDVMQLTQEFEKMQQENPEQFNQFIDQMLFGEPPVEEVPAQPTVPAAQPEETPAPTAQPQEPSKDQADREKQEEALRRINNIIKHTNSFLNKTVTMVEFPGKLKKWTEQGKIRGWIPGYAWESVKNNVGIKEQIEKMLQKLNAIKEQDRATKTYKYLDSVIANEGLYKNLGILERKLKELEPQVEIDEHGLEPVSKEARATIRTILGEYINALFALSIPQDLDTVMAAFETKAKKYRDEEEVSTKKALEDSKKNRPAQGTVVSGSPEGDFYAPSSGGMNPYDYFPYAGSSYQSPSDYGSSRAPESNIQEDKKESPKGEAGKPAGENKPKEKEKEEEDPKVKRAIGNFESNLSSAANSIENKDVDGAVRKVKKATGDLNTLKIRIGKAPEGQRKRFKSEISDIYDDHKETLANAEKMNVFAPAKKRSTPVLPARPTKRTVTVSPEDIAQLNVQAQKIVDTEIEQAIRNETSKAVREYKKDLAAEGNLESIEEQRRTEVAIEESITAPYEAKRDGMIKSKAEALVKEYKRSLQSNADEEYERAQAAWEAQAQAVESQQEESSGQAEYSIDDLKKAIEDLRKAYKAL